jgi:hypothetical protein
VAASRERSTHRTVRGLTDQVSRFALADPAVRNLQITQCCCELSRALAARTGGGPANWCRVATWALQAGRPTIRKEGGTIRT